ncbi:VOC family protein [Paenibacillus sp. JCM 10914]|uniref:VOC family protein n=1 Tax=Paenibacillus sp. JCM 10914 TaxID=1236974 RepID=UPI0003CC6571|nr:hypothetical protein [Paenibacillus sp. JCM 10914]GAE05048.1 hypothetical protein JCM10914_1132 [Paenibacillus sp. JCM 10914]
MITHFAELTLKTLSIQGVRQFYHGVLHFPIERENEDWIVFKPTPKIRLIFEQKYEPIAPVHLAFEVPYAEFGDIVQRLDKALPLLAWPDGTTAEYYEGGANVYFKDGDGNLLEFIAHEQVADTGFEPHGSYRVLYLREVGMPVEDPVAARNWMEKTLGLTIARDSELFAFVIGGTAHAVVVSTKRKWIPIDMYALPVSLAVTYGVSDADYVNQVRERLIIG